MTSMTASPLILLTGATGFVGRQVLRVLKERGCRVRAVVRDGKKDQIAAAVGLTTKYLRRKPVVVGRCVSWVDTVIHAAWYVKPGQYLQSPKNRECYSGTLRLAEGARQANVRRFVGIGTCFEYDLTVGYLSIADPPQTVDGVCPAKADIFTALSKLLPKNGIEFAWCRLFYLYGEGEDPRRLVPYVRGKLGAGERAEFSSGREIRDYLDVRDAGRMIADATLGSVQGPVNICSGKPITVREIAETIADEYKRRDLLRFGMRPDDLDPPCVVGIRSGH